MDAMTVIKLTDGYTTVVMSGHPMPCGVISIGDQSIKFRSATVECIEKELSPFEGILGDGTTYRFVFDDPIIPLAPEFIFNKIKYTQIPISAQPKNNS